MAVETSPAKALQTRHEAEMQAIEAMEVAVADFLDAVLAEARSAVDAMAQRSQLRASGPIVTFARRRNPFAYTNIREHWYSTVRELADRRADLVPEEIERVLLDSMLPAQVYEDVSEVLATARSSDWTTYQTKRHLSALLIPKSPREHERYKARVRFLGRTTATMNSSLKRLREFRDDESVVGKRWVAHHDERTRHSHLAANGQTVAIDDPFIVGGAALAFPGDPSAPMEEVANCRCVMVPAIKGDTDLAGLLTTLLAAAQAETLAYNPRQLRVPKGNGRLSGRWVDGPLRTLSSLIDNLAESRKAHSPNLQPASDADKAKFKDLYGKSIPPAWTDVEVDFDPDADLIGIGYDAKGRKKYVYTQSYEDAQAAAKWARLGQVADAAPALFDWTESIDGDPMKAAVRVMMTEGIRVGSSDEQRGDVKAYGATTLRAGHASVDKDGNVALDFTAKEGIPAHYEITDPETAKYIKERLADAGPDERLFPGVTADGSIEAIREQSGLPSMKNHDLRTLLANIIAISELDEHVPPPPKTAKEAQRIRKEIATVVSEHLHNKPAQALASYINPATLAPLLDLGGSA